MLTRILRLFWRRVDLANTHGTRKPSALVVYAAMFACLLVLLTACDQASSAPTALTATTASIATSIIPTLVASPPTPFSASRASSAPTAASPPTDGPTSLAHALLATATGTAVNGERSAHPSPTLMLVHSVPSNTSTTKPTATTAASARAVSTSTTVVGGHATSAPAPKAISASVYVFPVQPVSVTSYGPYHHDYSATDIFCPVGSRFVAPTAGIVDYVTTVDRWDPATDDPAVRGGLSVAIIGDDGVRYYGSHLSWVLDGIVPGVRVAAGQQLGLTGKTGDARFTAPHLHFGISPPTTPSDWKVRRGVISPYKYLNAWAVGTQLRPVLK